MLAFLDFEASSLAKDSYPVEVAWVFEDGACESHLIRPAPGWTDWDPGAERMHGLSRERLVAEGEPHDWVARRVLEALSGHEPCASAPSWDGKWLSVLLRAAGLPRHAMRLKDSEAVELETACELLKDAAAPGDLGRMAAKVLERARARIEAEPPAHRALADAARELRLWREVRRLARVAAPQPLSPPSRTA
jgi:hypothetical protein